MMDRLVLRLGLEVEGWGQRAADWIPLVDCLPINYETKTSVCDEV